MCIRWHERCLLALLRMTPTQVTNTRPVWLWIQLASQPTYHRTKQQICGLYSHTQYSGQSTSTYPLATYYLYMQSRRGDAPGRFSYTAAGNRTRISFLLTCNQCPESWLRACLPASVPSSLPSSCLPFHCAPPPR